MCKEIVRPSGAGFRYSCIPDLHSNKKMNKIPNQANPHFTLKKSFEISIFGRRCGSRLRSPKILKISCLGWNQDWVHKSHPLDSSWFPLPRWDHQGWPPGDSPLGRFSLYHPPVSHSSLRSPDTISCGANCLISKASLLPESQLQLPPWAKIPELPLLRTPQAGTLPERAERVCFRKKTFLQSRLAVSALALAPGCFGGGSGVLAS